MTLKIGGFQKNTLIDFPGVVASLVFTQGCNFRCPYCHNPGLIAFPVSESSTTSKAVQLSNTPAPVNASEIFAFLKRRKGLIDGVAITGGEPTLQPGLEPFCFRLKNMGLKVKLDTNGSKPDVIDNLLKRELVDFIAMDIKSNKTGYQYLTGDINSKGSGFAPILKSIRLIIKRSPAYEFRTTCVKPFISSEIMAEIGEMIKGSSHYVLQHCSKNVNMLNPEFFKTHDLFASPSLHDRQSPLVKDVDYPFFNDSELAELQDIVKGYVKSCSIR